MASRDNSIAPNRFASINWSAGPVNPSLGQLIRDLTAGRDWRNVGSLSLLFLLAATQVSGSGRCRRASSAFNLAHPRRRRRTLPATHRYRRHDRGETWIPATGATSTLAAGHGRSDANYRRCYCPGVRFRCKPFVC